MKNSDKFRQEVNPGGLSSYPHPWLIINITIYFSMIRIHNVNLSS